ncbi:MAG: phage terminase small subunit P27 family [Pseudomonadales bacterium]|nr:phage terminase small subunit P27 family [Pseudomonadales bacterium]
MTQRRSGGGRKPKPNQQKKLSGSKHYNSDAIEFDLVTDVEAPQWLRPLAIDIWNTVCPHLCKKKVLAVTDLHNLEAFCSSYATWREAEAEISRVGLTIATAAGGAIKNPACTVANESLRQMSTFGGMLGLDPASRGRLIGGGRDVGKNPFDKFII